MAQNDVQVANASDKFDRMTVGDFIAMLQANGLPSGGGAFSGARCYKTSAQQASFNFVIVEWNAEDYDTNNYHDNNTNNSRLTIPTAGYYSICAHVPTSANVTVQIRLIKNSNINLTTQYFSNVNNEGSGSPLFYQGYFAAGDHLMVSVAYGSLQSMAIGQNQGSFITIHKIG